MSSLICIRESWKYLGHIVILTIRMGTRLYNPWCLCFYSCNLKADRLILVYALVYIRKTTPSYGFLTVLMNSFEFIAPRIHLRKLGKFTGQVEDAFPIGERNICITQHLWSLGGQHPKSNNMVYALYRENRPHAVLRPLIACRVKFCGRRWLISLISGQANDLAGSRKPFARNGSIAPYWIMVVAVAVNSAGRYPI